MPGSQKSGVAGRSANRSAPNVVVNTAGVAIFPPKATFGPRKLTDFEFVWIIEGNVVGRFDEQAVSAAPGTILLSRPGMTDQYEWDRDRRTIHGYFHFSLNDMRRWPPLEQWPLARVMPEDDVIRPLFRYVLKLTADAERCVAQQVSSVVEVMLDAFIRGELTLAPQPMVALPVPLERALQTIHDAVTASSSPEVSLDQLAAVACVTRQHLCRLFRQHLQLGPMETVRLMRVQNAATLLSRSTMSIKEIAEATGFANQFHFSRVFRRTYGMSPQQYRTALWVGTAVPSNPVAQRLRLALWTLRTTAPPQTPITAVRSQPSSETPPPKSGGR